MIVADTNLIAYLVIDGARTAEARRAYERDPLWVAPPLWRSEFLNVLVTSLRNKLLTKKQAHTAWETALQFVRHDERDPPALAILDQAIASGISAYDAHYVVLARMLNCAFVTADRTLTRRCPEKTTLLEDFISREVED